MITTIRFLHPPLAHCRRLLKKAEGRPAHHYTHRLPTYIHCLLTPVAGRSAHRRSVHRPIVLLTERFTERSFHRRSFHRRRGFSRFTVGMFSPINRFTDRSFHRPLQESGHRLPAGRLRPPPPPRTLPSRSTTVQDRPIIHRQCNTPSRRNDRSVKPPVGESIGR